MQMRLLAISVSVDNGFWYLYLHHVITIRICAIIVVNKCGYYSLSVYEVMSVWTLKLYLLLQNDFVLRREKKKKKTENRNVNKQSQKI
jgi:hypothetical protein